MKGIVFTEFLEMVEQKFDYQMVDNLLNTTELESGGIYTSVGTYDYTEMVNLVVNLSHQSNISVPDLLKAFGVYLFKTFTKTYHHFMEKAPDAFTFLGFIHDYIHVEVKKLYPDAELPHFDISRPDSNTLIMIYNSTRKMSDLAYGLIEGCLEHYGEKALITQENINSNGSSVKFVIVKQ